MDEGAGTIMYVNDMFHADDAEEEDEEEEE